MAIPPRLPKHLERALGSDAAEDLVTLVDEMRSGLRADHGALNDRIDRVDNRLIVLDARVTALDGKVTALDGKVTALDGKVTALDARLTSIDDKLGGLAVRLADVRADLIKWSFVFWVAAVTVLAGVLR